MTNDNVVFFEAATALWGAATIAWGVWLGLRREGVEGLARSLTRAGLLVQGVALAVRWWERYQRDQVQDIGSWPVTDLFESIVYFAFAIVFIETLAERWSRVRRLGLFVVPLAAAAMVYAFASGMVTRISPMPPALKHNYWIYFHVTANFIAYASFAVGAGTALLYLLKQRLGAAPGSALAEALPPLETLEQVTTRVIMVGFCFLALGIVLGAAWAYEAWGRYWGWDPKETWALITLLVYAGFLHARLAGGWSGRRLALLAVGGFGVTLFCYLGVNLVLSGLHSYASR